MMNEIKCPKCGHEEQRGFRGEIKQSESGNTIFIECPACGETTRYLRQR